MHIGELACGATRYPRGLKFNSCPMHVFLRENQPGLTTRHRFERFSGRTGGSGSVR